MRYVFLFLGFFIAQFANAQQIISIPLQTSIDTTTILNVIQVLQDTVNTNKQDTIITPLQHGGLIPKQEIADSSITNDTIVLLQDTSKIAQLDTLPKIVVKEFHNPENITISKIITGEYLISNTKHTDIMIDSCIISTLIIENTVCKMLTINAVSVTHISIKNSKIDDFFIEDSSIGELRIENGEIIEFSIEQSAIKKQVIVSTQQTILQEQLEPEIENQE